MVRYGSHWLVGVVVGVVFGCCIGEGGALSGLVCSTNACVALCWFSVCMVVSKAMVVELGGLFSRFSCLPCFVVPVVMVVPVVSIPVGPASTLYIVVGFVV